MISPWEKDWSTTQDLSMVSVGPSRWHVLGTDYLGRDLLARLLCGGKISLSIGLFATAIATFIALVVGLLCGYVGGKLDYWIMRMVDVFQTLPTTLLTMLLMVYFGTAMWTLCVALGITAWFTFARVIRAQTQSLRSCQFVQSSLGIGQSHWRVLLLHILPSLWTTIRHYAILLLPKVILDEAFLSFIGLGISPPHSSWGNMIVDGVHVMQSHPLQLFFPSLFFVITLLAITSLAESF
ncbi:MAG: ABC transporter permease [Puniceicoccales bacterium]|nr:ABC transporter permease [Puniceicoccales bacterium]